MIETEGSGESQELWRQNETEFNTSRLDQLDADGINIQCVSSSDFVIGRQTNFNGPVTIINCDKGIIPKGITKDKEDAKTEEIVIKDKILSESAAETLQEMAAKNSLGKSFPEKSRRQNLTFWLRKNSFKIPNTVWIVFFAILIGAAIATTMVFVKPEVPELRIVQCRSSARKAGNICIYGDYKWGGRKNQKQIQMSLPVPYVVISETNGDLCLDFESCMKVVEFIQLQDEVIEDNVTLCNFFVGPDGNIYEDNGWSLANSLGGPVREKNINICLIGNDIDYPTHPQVKATKSLIRFGVENDYLTKTYVLMASNAASNRNLSANMYGIIKKWPRFRQYPFITDYDPPDEDYHIYGKEDWKGLPAKSVIEMKLPVPYVVISHSVSTQCFKFDTCAALIKGIQMYHQSLDYADIAYNFMIDSNGNIYEGRGWSRRNVAGGFINGRNIDINLIGDFSKNVKPTNSQMNGLRYLLRFGVENKKISPNYALLSANSTISTLSPGQNVYDIIKNWPHFDPDPEDHAKEYVE